MPDEGCRIKLVRWCHQCALWLRMYADGGVLIDLLLFITLWSVNGSETGRRCEWARVGEAESGGNSSKQPNTLPLLTSCWLYMVLLCLSVEHSAVWSQSNEFSEAGVIVDVLTLIVTGWWLRTPRRHVWLITDVKSYDEIETPFSTKAGRYFWDDIRAKPWMKNQILTKRNNVSCQPTLARS